MNVPNCLWLLNLLTNQCVRTNTDQVCRLDSIFSCFPGSVLTENVSEYLASEWQSYRHRRSPPAWLRPDTGSPWRNWRRQTQPRYWQRLNHMTSQAARALGDSTGLSSASYAPHFTPHQLLVFVLNRRRERTVFTQWRGTHCKGID